CHACMISLRGYCELCRERLSTTAGLIRVRIHKLEIPAHQVLVIIELGPLEIDRALRINDHFDAVELIHLIVLADFLIKIDRIAYPGTAATLHAEAESALRNPLNVDEALHFIDCGLCQRDHRSLGVCVRRIHGALPSVTSVRPSSDSRPMQL